MDLVDVFGCMLHFRNCLKGYSKYRVFGSVRGRPPSWVIGLRSRAIIREANLISSRGGPVNLDDET